MNDCSRSLLRPDNFLLQNCASLRHALQKLNDRNISALSALPPQRTVIFVILEFPLSDSQHNCRAWPDIRANVIRNISVRRGPVMKLKQRLFAFQCSGSITLSPRIFWSAFSTKDLPDEKSIPRTSSSAHRDPRPRGARLTAHGNVSKRGRR